MPKLTSQLGRVALRGTDIQDMRKRGQHFPVIMMIVGLLLLTLYSILLIFSSGFRDYARRF